MANQNNYAIYDSDVPEIFGTFNSKEEAERYAVARLGERGKNFAWFIIDRNQLARMGITNYSTLNKFLNLRIKEEYERDIVDNKEIYQQAYRDYKERQSRGEV